MENFANERGLYSSAIGAVKNSLNQRKVLERRVQELNAELIKQQTLYVRMLNAQKILSTISDDNTRVTLDFITGMVNKVLLELFPKEPYKIKLVPKLHAGTRPHIVVELVDCKGHILDTSVQSGRGIAQVISFMYVLCLIEIRKGRRLVIFDERLNGLHKSARQCMEKIMEIFIKGGYQFIFCEYGINNVGKVYNVEMRDGVSHLVPMDGREYTDDIVYVEDADLSLLSEEEEIVED